MWGLCPLVILPSTVIACGRLLTPWVFMWALSFAIYFGLKWLTWWDAKSRIYHSSWRSVGYLLAWPGMDADSFLSSDYHVTQPSASSWLGPIAKTISGGMLLWAVARLIPSQDPLLQGWAGMLGLVLLLHFGSFEIIALLWQSFGVTAEPIMRSPSRQFTGRILGKALESRFSRSCARINFPADVPNAGNRYRQLPGFYCFGNNP